MTEDATPSKAPLARRGLGSVLVGASYPFRALALLIVTPRLRQYVVIPILLNSVVGVTLYAGLLFAGLQAIDSFLAAIPTWVATAPHLHIDWPNWTLPLPHWTIVWPAWLPQLPAFQWPQLPPIALPHWVAELPEFGLALLIGLLRVLLVITLLLLTGFVLLQFGVLLGTPWYGQLSEELEKLQTGQLQTIPINPAHEIWRAILYELKKLSITLTVGTLLLLFSFFPGFGTPLATFGGIALAATIVCLDFFDAALERRRLRFRQKLGMIQRSLPASASFALVCLSLVSVPFLNLLAIPVCVAAGTLFVCDQVLPTLPADKSPRQKPDRS